jgi:hypothetical protein
MPTFCRLSSARTFMRVSPVFRFVGGRGEMQLHYLSKGPGKVNLGMRRKPL